MDIKELLLTKYKYQSIVGFVLIHMSVLYGFGLTSFLVLNTQVNAFIVTGLITLNILSILFLFSLYAFIEFVD